MENELTVSLFPEEKQKKVKNFWNHVHFHPTNAIEDAWGQALLDRIAEDGVADTVRVYAMLEEIVSRREDGTLAYDFSVNDVRLDYLTGRGFKIFLSYNYMPTAIAKDPSLVRSAAKNATRYKGTLICTSAPASYDEWEEVCRVYTAHVVERYGIDAVKEWRLQCFNEPDVSLFFLQDVPEDDPRRFAEYGKLYRAFVRGVLSVSEELSVGGPALGFSFPFLRAFLTGVKEQGTRLDFLSFHAYGTTPAKLAEGAKLSATDTLPAIRAVRETTTECGFPDLPMILDEWGMAINGCFGTEDCPDFEARDSEVFSAYFVRMLTRYDEVGIPFDKMMICLSGQADMPADFVGFRNFFTLHGFRKPIYNAYALAAHLRGEKFGFSLSRPCPALTVFPTEEGGRRAVLFSYADEHFSDGIPPLDLILPIGAPSAEVTFLDRTHANAYRCYQSIGSPEVLSEEDIARIREAGLLKTERVPTDGGVLRLRLTPNSVVLAEY